MKQSLLVCASVKDFVCVCESVLLVYRNFKCHAKTFNRNTAKMCKRGISDVFILCGGGIYKQQSNDPLNYLQSRRVTTIFSPLFNKIKTYF